MTENNLISAQNICKSFVKPDGSELEVINNVDLVMHEGKITALLGKSGSGKSTLLRIIAGLIAPSSGEVHYRGQAVQAPVPGISMFHPRYILAHPESKKETWKDLKEVRSKFT